MKKIKLSKSEYIILFNLIAAVVSCVIHLLGDAGITDSNGDQLLSAVFLGYGSIAAIWFCIFVPMSEELDGKRWMTKKEKNYTYLAYFVVSAVCFAVKGFPWMSLIPVGITSVLWLIFKAGGPYTRQEDVDAEEPACLDPFYYESDEKTLQTFGVGDVWYSRRRHKQLCKIYIQTAKDYSGRRSEQEIELIVRHRIMMAKSRGPATATCIVLVSLGLYFLLMPWCDLGPLIGILSLLQIYGVLGFAGNVHDSLTPREAAEFKNRDAVEKGGEPTYQIKGGAE